MGSRLSQDIILDDDIILVPKSVKSGAVQEAMQLGFNRI